MRVRAPTGSTPLSLRGGPDEREPRICSRCASPARCRPVTALWVDELSAVEADEPNAARLAEPDHVLCAAGPVAALAVPEDNKADVAVIARGRGVEDPAVV